MNLYYFNSVFFQFSLNKVNQKNKRIFILTHNISCLIAVDTSKWFTSEGYWHVRKHCFWPFFEDCWKEIVHKKVMRWRCQSLFIASKFIFLNTRKKEMHNLFLMKKIIMHDLSLVVWKKQCYNIFLLISIGIRFYLFSGFPACALGRVNML